MSQPRKHLNFASVLLVATALSVIGPQIAAAELKLAARSIAWQQVEPALTFRFFIERERYTTLDHSARLVFAVEAGSGGPKLEELKVRWTLKDQVGKTVAQQEHPIPLGLVDVTFDLRALAPGRYDVAAELLRGNESLKSAAGFLRYETVEKPAESGRIALRLPRGVPLEKDTYPVQAGIPFPKGAITDAKTVRVLDREGREVPSDAIVRSRWGHEVGASIRWLGVDFQPASGQEYTLEFGSQAAHAKPASGVKVTETPEAINIDTGTATLRISRKRFNLIDEWKTSELTLAPPEAPQHGLYLIDHQGAIYRAANDRSVKVTIEEQTAMRVVVRAEGWYVKDGAPPDPRYDFVLPTDKLCRFVTRIEAYAGKPYVRVMNTLILTCDTFKVRLLDAGMSLPMAGITEASFGVEDAKPPFGAAQDKQAAVVGTTGVRGVQHLHDAYTIEDGAGKSLAEAKHSAGWVIASSASGALAMSHRDTWQRFPKEFEVLPHEVRLHVWPAHGREHPQIDQLARNQMHRLLFAHQGKEMNMAMPWDWLFAGIGYYNSDAGDAGKPTGHVWGALHASGMGVATTSDVLIQLGKPADKAKLAETAACFQSAPHAVADPVWACNSLAFGYCHPYDPKNFATCESIMHDNMRGYWGGQDAGKMFGMWIYRSWHHSSFYADGSWELYRLFNGTHHHEAVVPWLFYARTADPFYLTQGMANIRQLTDVQMVHYDDENYTQREFYAGQRRLVGATRHDDAITPWGADYAILGHQTCYNGVMLAHYLTGDLRLREVVVDEWQKTLLEDRRNREYKGADISNFSFPENPRNNGNAIGELIDLYQLTYDPRILALLAPRMDLWLNSPGDMTVDWGQQMHNVLLFHGSSQAARMLLEGVKALKAGDSDMRKRTIARTGLVGNEIFALASILDPKAPWGVEAFSQMMYPYLRSYAWDRLAIKPGLVHCNSGEFMLFMPRTMYALAHSAPPELVPFIGCGQNAPRHPGNPTRVVIREDADQDILVCVAGKVTQPEGFDIKVVGPDGAPAAKAHVQPGVQAPFTMTIPRDGKTGQYVIFMGAIQKDLVLAPYTKLPEVYVHDYWSGNSDATRYFTRSDGSAPGSLMKFTLKPAGPGGTLLSADQKTVLATSPKGDAVTVQIGSEGAWIWHHTACYIETYRNDGKQPAILASSPDRWFLPSEKSLAVQLLP